MAVEQLTYTQLGERLGISTEAARQKAIRGRWRRIPGNDGKTLVEVDLAAVAPPTGLPEASATKRKPSKPRGILLGKFHIRNGKICYVSDNGSQKTFLFM